MVELLGWLRLRVGHRIFVLHRIVQLVVKHKLGIDRLAMLL
jgi:hypothetical protein